MEYRSAMVYNDDKIDHLPDIISKLLYHIIKEVNKFLDLHDEADYSGPTVRKSSNNLTIAYNIYPTKNKIDFFFKNLNEILSDSLNNYSKLGELIVYESNKGEIFDMGKKAFNIVKAYHFEFYIYEPGAVVYCRLLIEEDELKNKKWISIDFDIIIQSSWFSEN